MNSDDKGTARGISFQRIGRWLVWLILILAAIFYLLTDLFQNLYLTYPMQNLLRRLYLRI